MQTTMPTSVAHPSGSSHHNSGTTLRIKDLIRLRHHTRALKSGSRKKVDSLLSGNEQSPFKGRGIDFEEVRRYQSGDDIRHMDWRVTARSGTPHLKVFREERQRLVFLIVDFSPSMFFGTRVAFKSVIAAQAASLLAWAAMKQGDRIGGLVFTGDSHRDIRPRGGQAGALRMLHTLVEAHGHANGPAAGQGPHTLPAMLARTVRTVRSGSVIFLISDFHHFDQSIESSLKHLHLHHDLIAVSITDPLEEEPPPPGRYRVSDGKNFFDLDTANHTLREEYTAQFRRRRQVYDTLYRRLGIGKIQLSTCDSVPPALRNSLRTLSAEKHRHPWVHRQTS